MPTSPDMPPTDDSKDAVPSDQEQHTPQDSPENPDTDTTSFETAWDDTSPDDVSPVSDPESPAFDPETDAMTSWDAPVADDQVPPEPNADDTTQGTQEAADWSEAGDWDSIADHMPEEATDPAPKVEAEPEIVAESQDDPSTDTEPVPSVVDPAPSRASQIGARVSGAANRLGLGKLLQPSEDVPGDAPKTETRTRARTAPGWAKGPFGGMIRATEGFRGFLDPNLEIVDLVPHRRFLGVAAFIGLLFLVSNSAGLALLTLGLVVPVLVVMTLVQHDVFEKESNLLISAVAVAGGVAGLVLGWFASWLQNDQWFSIESLRVGAAGFGGRLADDVGAPPFIVWFMNGLALPALAVAAIGGIPIALRRWPQFRNEVMDGVILAGATAAGFAVGTQIVYWWPMMSDTGPRGEVDEWTLRIVGVLLFRSLVIVWCGAMIGAGVWRYMMAGNAVSAALPAFAGVLGVVLLMFGSLQLQSSNPWAEFLWTVVLAAASYLLFRYALDQAVAQDRKALGSAAARVVCPHCHRVTPHGAFCAYCGGSLLHEAKPAESEAEPAAP